MDVDRPGPGLSLSSGRLKVGRLAVGTILAVAGCGV
jgi:hypothetical protein